MLKYFIQSNVDIYGKGFHIHLFSSGYCMQYWKSLIKIYRLDIYPKFLLSKLKCKKYIRYESKPKCPQLPARASQKVDIIRTNGDGPYPGAFLAAC